jgi:hypothetical protein
MFDEFWSLCIRKIAKKDAEKAFNQLKSDERLKAIEAMPKHVEYWKTTNTEMTFIPYPASWLRGARFDDELELPAPKQPTQAWWTTEAGTLAKGKELGIAPGMGESMQQYRARLTNKTRVG